MRECFCGRRLRGACSLLLFNHQNHVKSLHRSVPALRLSIIAAAMGSHPVICHLPTTSAVESYGGFFLTTQTALLSMFARCKSQVSTGFYHKNAMTSNGGTLNSTISAFLRCDDRRRPHLDTPLHCPKAGILRFSFDTLSFRADPVSVLSWTARTLKCLWLGHMTC